ncbi:fasciclin domain-containing protein [Aliidiomarina maris]|uniref:Putative surface protein with fasciclin (FAS1) repeats n=1 Tax=Aliidiomarina maris TaxID=531312 RepID=A0A327WS73_9GAMM|nr:fasciclin domain-containing protein [Aliidiomarina maris]RAJ95273.1 putative surface protein with fasciclin (FAS1) repeats [Aliidiomarina maris]RUO21032.1 hypothetical protein CWE07_11710 [Aliidiomarina maris]
MLRTFGTTTLAALIAATFSAGAMAQQEQRTQTQQQQQQQQQERMGEQRGDEQRRYEKGSKHDDKTIVEVLNEKDRFSKFSEALEQADMKDKLNDSDSYTVFAPTNEAFERLPQGTWEQWMEDDNRDQLREILSYHIVEERVSVDDIGEAREEHASMQGEQLRVANAFGSFTVNTASVTHADIETENGYIHAIDTVLMDASRTGRQAAE